MAALVRLAYALGGPDPIKIVSYRGFGTTGRLFGHGRVLEDQGIRSPRDDDSIWLEPPQSTEQHQEEWRRVELELIEPRSDKQPGPVRAETEVLVPSPSAHFGVISDIDDTVLKSDATSLLRMARTVFLGNASTRLPFPGAAAS